MSAKIIDFYEGAARARGYASMSALEEEYWAAIDAEMEIAQAKCTHPAVESDMCMDCGKDMARSPA